MNPLPTGVANAKEATEDGRTSLMEAATWGCVAVMNTLLGNRCNICEKNKVARTALIFASVGDDMSTVKLLLERGANIEAADK